jgi:uncharacterized protein YdhG (YjbR/CyaY superfamily)
MEEHRMRIKGATKPATIDEYLSRLTPEQRAALETLRKTIRSAMPSAEECISYGMPGFRHHGKVVVWMGAAATHCAFYPGGVVDQFEDELADFETSKGTIRFQPEAPLPAALVRRIVKMRLAQNAMKAPRAAKRAR